jgi:thiamine-phosphate pyrophosphorylase
MRPVICLITPTVRSVPEEGRLVDRLRAAARAGVHLIQIRQRDMDGCALARLVERAVSAVRGTGARVLVNDRVDVALAMGAHGVHLRGDSVAASRVRALVPPGFVIGRSVHSPEEASRAALDGGLDFLVFGTVFETRSKPGADVAGTARLTTACEAVSLPVLAVGGITAPRLRDVAAAGTAGFAAIGLFADASIEQMAVVVREASAAFDTPDHRF